MHLSIIVATLEGVSFQVLNDPERMAKSLEQAVCAGGFTLLHQYIHQFSPQGLTAMAVLSESHISLHSWPEHGALFVDMATCSGPVATEVAFERLCEFFPHQSLKRQTIEHGGPSNRWPLPSVLAHGYSVPQ